MSKNLKQIIFTSAVVIVTFFLFADSAMAAPTTIISTTDAPVQGQNGTLDAFNTKVLAQSFVTDNVGGVVNTIVIQDAYVNPSLSGHNIQLYDVGGEGTIGNSIGTFGSTPAVSSGLMTFTPTTEITLAPNTMYWVVVKSDTGVVWKYGNTSNSGTGTIPESMYRARSTDGGSTWSYDSDVNAGGGFGTGAWNFNMRVLVNPPLSIEPTAASQVQRTTATLEGRIQNPSWDTNNPNITAELGLAIGTTPGFILENAITANAVSSTSADESGYYSIPFSSLACGTNYYVKAYVRVYDENPGGENRILLSGETSTGEISFTTDGCFTVGMDNVSDITQTGATLHALVQNPIWNNVDSSAVLRFYVDTQEEFGSPNAFSVQAESMDNEGYYSAAIPTENPLTCGTTYYAMAEVYAYDQEETWSETVASGPYSFTTSPCTNPTPSSSSSSGYNPAMAWTPITEDKKTCPTNQLLTQNLKSGSRNGTYNSYTKGIVKEAHILQAHLNRLGFSSGKEDGILGKLSDGAIKRMQTFLKTKADGYVGPVTRGLINNSCGSEGLKKS